MQGKGEEKKSENLCRGLHKRTISQNHLQGKRRDLQYHQFFINIGAQSLNFQMSVTVRIMPGELSCALVGKQGGGPGASSLSIPRVTQEEAIPLHGVHLVEVTLPLHQHRTLWAPLSCPAYQYSNKDSGLIDPSVLNSTTK